jgi:hypothetical protein
LQCRVTLLPRGGAHDERMPSRARAHR